ncbi:helix-turn-helix transcriptional regulator [Ruminococcus sp.]|uniref:helix-turn-helix domain-containing protein n=1 Tax=Ruminococcus sp. TaxID=41978 RepID=UPI0025D17FFE|nr:helix-turn-helix transcriptional regulator [Ruminococcus sp.]
MDYKKIGELICQLRKEKGLTQLQLAEKLHVSDKAVSKWERGIGCPDVSILNALANEQDQIFCM